MTRTEVRQALRHPCKHRDVNERVAAENGHAVAVAKLTTAFFFAQATKGLHSSIACAKLCPTFGYASAVEFGRLALFLDFSGF